MKKRAGRSGRTRGLRGRHAWRGVPVMFCHDAKQQRTNKDDDERDFVAGHSHGFKEAY
ncbi:MAG: hypothetical protein JWL59_4465 [Chthoniobacteraceae bacterium]|nr:hypothetical protein [Chthoniobacteraceae bacterium]